MSRDAFAFRFRVPSPRKGGEHKGRFDGRNTKANWELPFEILKNFFLFFVRNLCYTIPDTGEVISMKRTLSLLLVLVLLLPGCGKKQNETTIQPCEVMVRVMWACTPEYAEDGGLFHWYLYSGMRQYGFGEDDEYYSDEEMNTLLSDFYGLEDLNWYDAAFVRMEGVRAFELAVLSVPRRNRTPWSTPFKSICWTARGPLPATSRNRPLWWRTVK